MPMDFFAEIGRQTPGREGRGLIQPGPQPLPERRLALTPCARPAAADPDVREDSASLAEELEALRSQYAPFLRDLAPAFPSLRRRLELRDWDWQVDGEATWTPVRLPHYGPPLGPAITRYRRRLDVEAAKQGERAYLRIDGADYWARVYVNGRFVGQHEGFFASFEFDVSEQLRPGENEIVIELENDHIMMGSRTEEDPQRIAGDKLYAATGPGYDRPGIGWYACPPGMGLIDKVYLEWRAPIAVDQCWLRALDGDEVELWIEVKSSLHTPQRLSFELALYGANHEQTLVEGLRIEPGTDKAIGVGDTYSEVLARRDGSLGARLAQPCGLGMNRYIVRLDAAEMRWWQPDAPWLYELQLTVYGEDGTALDHWRQALGRRLFTQDLEATPRGAFYLNGEVIRLRGANTMGFEQQAMMRGDDARLIDDILLAKLCNMNFLRLTQRPVQPRMYELCDRLGLLIQTDLPLFACLRRDRTAEALRQAEEMERHIRPYACCILASYINEPFPNAYNQPQRHLERAELEGFFAAADYLVRLNNPDRVIKHVDGDYDPPSASLPDSHCYTLWYNGHGIDIGQLHKGYWMPVKPDWYYACGEFGSEGLEDWALMREAYPASWLPQPGEADEDWDPGRIEGAQTGDFYHFFYDRPTSPEAWIDASQAHQAEATRLMTEAFRRDGRMNSFAIHLFIDAFPAGWMKTIMDSRRQPKRAYFAYRHALAPLLLSLRSDRHALHEGERAQVECWVCNDSGREGPHRLSLELVCDGQVVAEAEEDIEVRSEAARCHLVADIALPSVRQRRAMELRGRLLDGEIVVAQNRLELDVFPQHALDLPPLLRRIDEVGEEELRAVREGALLWVEPSPVGSYRIDGLPVEVELSGMAPLHFASAKTGHPWAEGFEPRDFRRWYDSEHERIVALADATIHAPDWQTVLGTRNLGPDGQWREVALVAERALGAGRIVLSQIPYRRVLEQPAGRILLSRMS